MPAPRISALLLAAALCATGGTALAITPTGGNASAAAAESHVHSAPTEIPDALRPAFYQALAKDAGSSAALDAKGCATLNTRQLTGCFGRDGARFSAPQAAALSLNLAAWGRGAKLAPVAAVAPAIAGNAIRYAHGNLTEWWKVLPVGFEQGFTIAKRPAGSGELTLALTANDPAIETKGDLAWGKLRYGQLVVTDARGKLVPASLKTRGKRVLLSVNDAQAAYPLTVDPLVWIEQKVTASDGAAGDVFGTSVAISGTVALIGASNVTVNGNTYQGAAYVFTESNGSWTQTAKLTADDGAANNYFGYSVVLSGQTALIGATGATVGGNAYQGAAYVFTESGGTWTQTQELTANDGTADAGFGNSVALDGTTAMVGEFDPTSGGSYGQGAVYVFNEIQVCGGNYTWQVGQKLQASDGAPQDLFGYSIALAGGTAVIGAENATVNGNAGQGAAYVFTGSGGTWTQAQKLVANDGAANSGFGWSVGLSGTTALVGAISATVNGNTYQGAAYVFNESGGTWSQAQKLTASNGAANDAFGASVAISGQTALIGAPGAVVNGNYNHGAAYVFNGPSGTWSQGPEILPGDNPAHAQFGNSVALSGTTALIGAYEASPGGNSGQGAAYFESSGNLALALNAPQSAVQGQNYQSQAIVTNNATDASSAVSLVVPVQAATSLVSATSADGTCTTGSASVSCALTPIAANGGTAKVNLTLKATGTIGSTVASSASVSGTTPPLTASASTTIAGTPVVSLSPTSLAFGTIAVGSSATAQTVTLTNTGNGDLTNIVLSLAGTNAGDFSETSTCAASLPSTSGSNSCTVTVTFKPTAGGAASATLSIASNAASSPNTVALTGTGDVPPVANNQSLSVYAGQALAGQLTATASGGGTLTYAAVTQPAHGTLTLTASSGSFTYTPAAGYTGSDSFTFTASDGVATSNVATVTITVNAAPVQPTAPVANNLTLSAIEGQTATGQLTATASSGGTLTYAAVTQPTHGSLQLNAASGAFTYTPATGYTGSDSFSFTANDGVATSNVATVTVTVNAAPVQPTAPVANNQAFSIPDNASWTGTLTATGSGTLTYAISTKPGNGIVTLTGSSGAFSYTPNPAFTGTDSFEFTASNGTATSQPATVTITVTPASGPAPIGPTPPAASNATFSTGPGGTVIGKLSATGGDGQPLTYTVVIKPVHGSLSLNAQTGAFTYTPAAGFDGDSFTYTVSDGTTTSSPATVTFAKHGGGGAFGIFGLLLLAPLVGWRKRRT